MVKESVSGQGWASQRDRGSHFLVWTRLVGTGEGRTRLTDLDLEGEIARPQEGFAASTRKEG